jgi:uncharacterized membrane protein YqjE
VAAADRANPRQSVALLFLPGAFMSLLAFTIFLFYPAHPILRQIIFIQSLIVLAAISAHAWTK